MRLHRFYVTQPLGEEVVIHEIAKIKQWTKVFRYKPNDVVILFNGDGYDVEYLVVSITPKECVLKKQKRYQAQTPEKNITVYLSLIKKDAFELVVQKVTELGITEIVPVTSERVLQKNLNFKRLQAIAIESSEQCGRGDIPVIRETIPLVKALQKGKDEDVRIVLEKNGVPFTDQELKKSFAKAKTIGIFIGPEGGWSKNDLETFLHTSVTAVTLGNLVLRAETAAIVASSFVVQRT